MAIVWLVGLDQLKNPMTSSGIKPATFQLVAQCLNQLRHCMPPCSTETDLIHDFTFALAFKTTYGHVKLFITENSLSVTF
jgi:hypothetical protein